MFDIDGNGVRERMAWTRAGDEIAFLVRDRNGNGLIDDGTELFGNHSILPSGQRVTNGFEALTYYDRVEYGGNGDGVIDVNDAVWLQLRLWIDRNHNGLSETDELYSLANFDLHSISLDIRTTNRADAFGNVFRYAAKCRVGHTVRIGYDIYFTARPKKRSDR